MYEVIIGSIETVVETAATATEPPKTKDVYSPDKRKLMVIAKNVEDTIAKVELTTGEHIESVARHHFIDII